MPPSAPSAAAEPGYGFTVSVALCTDPPGSPGTACAVICTCVNAPAFDVTIWNGAELAPAGITTCAGTEATAGFELLNCTLTVAPSNAGPFSTTLFPPELSPPVIDAGPNTTAASARFCTVKPDVRVTVPAVPRTSPATAAPTEFVVIRKLADVAPAATFTDAGTASASGAVETNCTVKPAAGAGPERYTLPV